MDLSMNERKRKVSPLVIPSWEYRKPSIQFCSQWSIEQNLITTIHLWANYCKLVTFTDKTNGITWKVMKVSWDPRNLKLFSSVLLSTKGRGGAVIRALASEKRSKPNRIELNRIESNSNWTIRLEKLYIYTLLLRLPSLMISLCHFLSISVKKRSALCFFFV